MRENISKLSPAMLQDALNKVYIPLWTPHLSVEEIAAYSLLGGVSESTAYRWMGKLGFVYSTTRAGYYVDNHEAPAVVEYREKYLSKLRVLELRQFVWIQMPIEVAKSKYPDLLSYEDRHNVFLYFGDATRIIDDNSTPNMVEMHVDLEDDFFKNHWDPHLPEPDYLKHHGLRSVRHPHGPSGKALVIFGQDESVSKGEGTGIMVSAFTSRLLGFNPTLSDDELKQINDYRAGKQYMDPEAAIVLFGTADKSSTPLTTSPYIRYLLHGSNQEGKSGD